jgi:hypothetical protein
MSVISESIELANAQEEAEKRLTVALGYRSQALIDQATAIQQMTTYEDDAVIAAQAMLAMFVKDESQIKKATEATLNLAAAKGMDLKNAADLVSKTLGSTTNLENVRLHDECPLQVRDPGGGSGRVERTAGLDRG